MAIHEVTISLGVILGSGAGGYLSRNFGIYWPYWFAIIVLALGLIAQVVVWFVLRNSLGTPSGGVLRTKTRAAQSAPAGNKRGQVCIVPPQRTEVRGQRI